MLSYSGRVKNPVGSCCSSAIYITISNKSAAIKNIKPIVIIQRSRASFIKCCAEI